MKKRLKISNKIYDDTSLAIEVEQGVKTLEEGGIIAFPTETYFGLGADIERDEVVEKLFTFKKRSLDKPILVLIDDISQLEYLVESIPETYHVLMEHFWPGPLTMIFPALPSISSLLTGNTGTIGVRISSNPITRHLCQRWGKPLTATSANLSGVAPAQTRKDVIAQFGDSIDFILREDGSEKREVGSTIVSEKDGRIQVLREGPVSKKDIQAILMEKK